MIVLLLLVGLPAIGVLIAFAMRRKEMMDAIVAAILGMGVAVTALYVAMDRMMGQGGPPAPMQATRRVAEIEARGGSVVALRAEPMTLTGYLTIFLVLAAFAAAIGVAMYYLRRWMGDDS
jgi:hypothetical protein